ncbi:hypothetical protein HaLaN_05584 [Haematococcus lacustris]|uniref:Uncharacterized protein n=1 Tax=Haematococcus lacustris TaxID=44745 RepID=A0A699YRE6_HAELA|nr:hypothetical protein HaLaN_05584 [Haematococcus lacustris]
MFLKLLVALVLCLMLQAQSSQAAGPPAAPASSHGAAPASAAHAAAVKGWEAQLVRPGIKTAIRCFVESHFEGPGNWVLMSLG